MSLSLISPAKINLFLYVRDKRDDGMHELYSLMALIDLCDQIKIEFKGSGIKVGCDHPKVPADPTNLAWQAADLFVDHHIQKLGAPPFQGIDIQIDKKIPVGGGLGGGSSNAAAILTGLNKMAGQPFLKAELEKMALTLGADVPFFILGEPAFASGVGEQLIPCGNLPRFWVVVCSPGVSANTGDVFKKLEFGLTFTSNYIMNTGSNTLVFEPELDGREELHNDLEGPACKLYPEISSTKEEMALLLQRNVYMSGSGSSLFALYSDHAEANHGFRRIAKAWEGKNRQVFLSRIGEYGL
ncbi:MAG: 4-(cytidine 5'-diphospho)-2-C-methyl-D-erythritol kinase [Desulfobacter sp.]|nr:4-(cytidine 5'-diphospho)-2-C-methyl-D-erythritol kinase [Desulfobacter sp.]